MSVAEKISDFIGKWIIVLLGVTVSIGAFVNMFDISVNMLVVAIVTAFISGIIILVSKLKRKRMIIIILGVIVALLVIFLRHALINGIYSVANSIISVYNEYFGGMGIAYFKVKERGRFFRKIVEYNTLLVCVTAIIYSYILVTATCYKVFASIHILLSMIFVIPGMLLGKIPNTFCVALLVIYYLICFMYQNNRTIYPVRMAGLLLISLWAVGMVFLLNPPSKYNAEQRYEKYRDKLNHMADKLKLDDWSIKGLKSLFKEEKTATGGINGGRLGEVEKIKYSGDVMLKLRMQPDENNLYLKGFVANEYEGNSWNEMSNSHVEIYRKFALFEHSDIDLFTNNSSKLYEDKMKFLSVRYENDAKEYRFFPYFCDMDSLFTADFVYDLRLENDGTDSYSYSHASIGENEYYGYFHSDDTSELIETLYYDISYDVPDNISEMFDELLDKPVHYDFTPSGLEKCVKYVRDFLNNNTTYSINPGKLEEGEDYVVDFLTKKKKGYCTAYASSAVLMFRYLGIPARYVEGYIVTAADTEKITPNEDGYIDVDVKDYSAHAWAEIYVSGLGFVPIEVTPGYSSSRSWSGGGETERTQTVTEKITTTQEQSVERTTKAKETDTSIDESDTETIKQQGTDRKNKNYVYGIILFVIIAGVISVYLYKAAEKKKNLMNYKTQDYRHNIIVLSVVFKKELKKLNIKYAKDVNLSEISEEINRRIDVFHKMPEKRKKKVLHIDTQDTLAVLEIIAKAQYCDEFTQITAEEYDKVRQYVEEFKNSLQYLKNKV